jgi:hypothetical protein
MEMLSENTCALQMFGIERYKLKKLNVMDVNMSKFQTGLQLWKT